MGIIDKFVNTVAGSRAADLIQGAGDRLSSFRQGIQGFAGGLISTVANGSPFVGMNYQAVPQIRTAIREYVNAIQQAADELNTGADAEQALKGEITGATKQYVAAIKEVCDAYVSHLLAYSDKMQEYYEAYAKSDTQTTESVTTEATNLSGSVEKYVEQK